MAFSRSARTRFRKQRVRIRAFWHSANADENGGITGYCQFIFEFTRTAESGRMASVSVNTAETVIKACIELMKGDFRTSLGKSLDAILEYSEAKGGRIMLVDHEKKQAVNLCERAAKDAWPARPLEGDAISYDLICTWEDMIGVSNCVIVQNAQDMDALAGVNRAWAESMKSFGVRSLVLIPLRRRETVLGYLYVVNFNVEKVVEVKELVELMAFFLGTEIFNHQLMRKLGEISRVDALTGLKNRRAMEEKLLEIQTENAPFGIINLDLNGLKEVNDSHGHAAGDMLLIRAAGTLRGMFCEDEIFRTGGDEFIVLSPGITREGFAAILTRLRENSCRHENPCFAFGGFWSDGTEDVRTAFRLADERMYDDKQAYYRRNPERRRR